MAAYQGFVSRQPLLTGVTFVTLVLFNKPYGVICQFSPDGSGKPTLGDYICQPGIYPAGRLDHDSEGLVVLTDDGKMQARITSPSAKMPKTYLVQVEGIPSDAALDLLRHGIELKDGRTRPAGVARAAEPAGLWPRNPPIRERRSVPDSWIEITLTEGRNRQVRRMTAAAGYPTLRLIRTRIGDWDLSGIGPGDWRYGDAPPRPVKPGTKPRSSRGLRHAQTGKRAPT